MNAGLKETTMSNTNDNSKLDHRELTDTELDAVNGGRSHAVPKLYEALCKGTHLPEVTSELW